MGYLQLLKQIYKLPVDTTQILQDQLMMNCSDIILFYEDHVQLWNLDVQKRLYISKTNQSIYFWSVYAPITDLSFVFVSLEYCESSLGTFNFGDNKTVKLCDLPSEQENYNSVFYFETTGQYCVHARGKDNRLLFWDGKEMTDQKIDENHMVEKYSNDAIAIYTCQNQVTSFEIQKGKSENKKYTISGIEEGSIISIQEYSTTQAIIGIQHCGKTSSVLLYSLTSGLTLKTQKIDFPLDNIVKLSDFWIAMCTTQQQGNSTVKIQSCFGQTPSHLEQTTIERWIRYWNPYLPIITLSHSEESEQKKECHVEVVKCAPKRSVYIKLMEELGIVKDFGQEIVRSTINNF